MYEYELLDPEVADADTASLRARLLANLRTQAAVYTALAQQPPCDDPDAVTLRGVGLPLSGTPVVLAGNAHEGTVSPTTPRTRQHPVADDGDVDLATMPFGYGPYARPKHQVGPSDGRNLEATFAAVEDSPPMRIYSLLSTRTTRAGRMPRGATHGTIGRLFRPRPRRSAVGKELHRARVPKRTMADRSPPQSSDYHGRSAAIECDSPPPENFPPPMIDAAPQWPALGADLPPHGAASTEDLAGATTSAPMGALPPRGGDRTPSPRATMGTHLFPAQGPAPHASGRPRPSTVPPVATGLFPGDAGAAARGALAALMDASAGNAGAGAPRMPDGPDLPLEHSPHAKAPAASKLCRRTIAVLEALPRRLDEPALRAVKYEGLQALMKANGIPRTKYMGVPEFVTVILAWLRAHPDDELCLLPGLSRRATRGDGLAPTLAGAAPGAGALLEHLFGPPLPNRSPPPAPSPHAHSAGTRGASELGVQHAATMP